MNPEDFAQEIQPHIDALAGGQKVLRGGVHVGAPGDPWTLQIEVETASAPAAPPPSVDTAFAPGVDTGLPATTDVVAIPTPPADTTPAPPQGELRTNALPNFG